MRRSWIHVAQLYERALSPRANDLAARKREGKNESMWIKKTNHRAPTPVFKRPTPKNYPACAFPAISLTRDSKKQQKQKALLAVKPSACWATGNARATSHGRWKPCSWPRLSNHLELPWRDSKSHMLWKCAKDLMLDAIVKLSSCCASWYRPHIWNIFINGYPEWYFIFHQTFITCRFTISRKPPNRTSLTHLFKK